MPINEIELEAVARALGLNTSTMGTASSWIFREALAKDLRTSPEILTQLAGDSNISVRCEVASNLNTPFSVLQSLLNDPNSVVKKAAQKNPNSLAALPSKSLLPEPLQSLESAWSAAFSAGDNDEAYKIKQRFLHEAGRYIDQFLRKKRRTKLLTEYLEEMADPDVNDPDTLGDLLRSPQQLLMNYSEFLDSAS